MYQMHNIFTYRVKHSSSTAWLRRATYKCIKLRNCLLFLLCSVCERFFFFAAVVSALFGIWQFSNENMHLCAESRYTYHFFIVVDFLRQSARLVLLVENSLHRAITLHLHASMQHTAGSTEQVFVRFIRPISHCFRATIDKCEWRRKKRKYYFSYCVRWNILLCIGQAFDARDTWTIL